MQRLQRVFNSQEAFELVDLFEINGHTIYVRQLYGKHLLSDVMSNGGVKLAINILVKLGQVMQKLHASHVVLRHLNPTSVSLKRSRHDRATFVFGRICEYDLARCLQPGCKIVEGLKSDCQVAPEIELGIGHDFRADIWSLGHLVQQILKQSQSGQWLDGTPQELIKLTSEMMAQEPS